MMTLQNGRPADPSGRIENELRSYALLEALGVSYQRVDHRPAMTMGDCAEIDKVLQAATCKNLFLCNRQETAFYLLLIPGNKPFKTKDLSAQLGISRLSFANETHLKALLDLTPGSVSVLGLQNDPNGKVQLVIDKDVLAQPYFGCHPCINTSSIRFSVTDLQQTVLPALKHTPIYVDLPVSE